ncbi:MAG: hypothetical protein KA144_07720 [Xanthomonadaceae bacterium]|nr:hypothetical protein [Xanthomonadaceae bacterium]
MNHCKRRFRKRLAIHYKKKSESTGQGPARSASKLKPWGRSLGDFGTLGAAEKKLLTACKDGKLAKISKVRPSGETSDNRIRASFLRFLILGGDENAPVHEKGPRVSGAWITGRLDICYTTAKHSIYCRKCRFTSSIQLIGCTLNGSLRLEGCRVSGIDADGLIVHGDIFLRNRFRSSKEVRFIGARISGDLDCSNGQFLGASNDSISIDRINVDGDVYLSGKLFRALSGVSLTGAHIVGNLYFDEANLSGGLTAAGVDVSGGLFFQKLQFPVSPVVLMSSQLGALYDDAESWGNDLNLDGLEYRILGNGAPTDAKTRLEWLEKQNDRARRPSDNHPSFNPQPWRQIQHVLREMGHIEDSRQIGIAFEKKIRDFDMIGVPPLGWKPWISKIYRRFSRTAHWVFGALTGYGYRPYQLVLWCLICWLACGGFYWRMALPDNDVFAPSDPLVFLNPAFSHCRATTPNNNLHAASSLEVATTSTTPNESSDSVASEGPENHVVKEQVNWYTCESTPAEYPGFSPFAYSLDVMLPLVDLQQENYWGPIISPPDDEPFYELIYFDGERITRLVIWLQTLFGWVVSVLLVAIVSGLTRRREE